MSSTESIPFKKDRHFESKDTYALPADARERDRLMVQHRMLIRIFDDKLIHAPVAFNSGSSILDVGTGSCIWPLDVATRIAPQAQISGIDLTSKLYPPDVPSNVTLETGTVLDLPSKYTDAFDLVNQRLLIAALRRDQWITVCKNLVRAAKSGGWVQMLEYSQFGKGVGPYSDRFAQLHQALCDHRQVDHRTAAILPACLQECGLVRITVDERERPAGKWAGPEGSAALENLMELYRGFQSVILGAGGFGIVHSEQEYDELLKGLATEMNANEGSCDKWVSVYGQKPLQ